MPDQGDLLDTLADREILFALLSLCLPWSVAASAADELIETYKSFAEVIAVPAAQLAGHRSMTVQAASALKAVHTAALHLSRSAIKNNALFDGTINTMEKLTNYLHVAMSRDRSENFRALFLDTRNRLIADEVIAQGDVNVVCVTPRQVIRRAMELNSTAMIIVHNHPSGDITPSRQDIVFTEQVRSASEALGIALHDHLIVGNGTIYSFRQNGFFD